MNVSGYAGGIVGYNISTVEYSNASGSQITYYWKTDNGRIGGIAGRNTNNGKITKCISSVHIEWNSTSNSRSIKPCLGGIIGYNAGSYSDCTSNGTNHIQYYYWHFIGWYDQSDNCFKVDGGKVGYKE